MSTQHISSGLSTAESKPTSTPNPHLSDAETYAMQQLRNQLDTESAPWVRVIIELIANMTNKLDNEEVNLQQVRIAAISRTKEEARQQYLKNLTEVWLPTISKMEITSSKTFSDFRALLLGYIPYKSVEIIHELNEVDRQAMFKHARADWHDDTWIPYCTAPGCKPPPGRNESMLRAAARGDFTDPSLFGDRRMLKRTYGFWCSDCGNMIAPNLTRLIDSPLNDENSGN